jgi:hypothetical protein
VPLVPRVVGVALRRVRDVVRHFVQLVHLRTNLWRNKQRVGSHKLQAVPLNRVVRANVFVVWLFFFLSRKEMYAVLPGYDDASSVCLELEDSELHSGCCDNSDVCDLLPTSEQSGFDELQHPRTGHTAIPAQHDVLAKMMCAKGLYILDNDARSK